MHKFHEVFSKIWENFVNIFASLLRASWPWRHTPYCVDQHMAQYPIDSFDVLHERYQSRRQSSMRLSIHAWTTVTRCSFRHLWMYSSTSLACTKSLSALCYRYSTSWAHRSRPSWGNFVGYQPTSATAYWIWVFELAVLVYQTLNGLSVRSICILADDCRLTTTTGRGRLRSSNAGTCERGSNNSREWGWSDLSRRVAILRLYNSIPGWCFPRRGSTTSTRSSASCTGSKYRSRLTVSLPFSFTSVCKV